LLFITFSACSIPNTDISLDQNSGNVIECMHCGRFGRMLA